MKALVLIAALFGSAAVFAAPCKEGAKATFLEAKSGNSDRYNSVIRTCKNGTYMTDAEKAAWVSNPSNKCKEGAKAAFTKPGPNGDGAVTVWKTCKNGTYMTAAEKAAYVYNPSTKCKEGAISYGTDGDYNTVEKCVNGKYKVISKSRRGGNN